MKSCETCKFYQEVDARQLFRDPTARFMMCIWKNPVEPYWMLAPYQSIGLNMAAVRKPTDGENCGAWEEK